MLIKLLLRPFHLRKIVCIRLCIINNIVLNMMFTITRDLVVPWHDLDLCPPLTQTPDLVVLDSTVHGYNG